ncbi:MAG: VOC family protein [Vicinamibacterales bacterium]
MARLYRVILPVPDIERAAAFYGAVLGTPGARVSPGRHYFAGADDGAILACYDPAADGDPGGQDWRHHENQYLYFAVGDLEAARDRLLAAGAGAVTPIDTLPWGERMVYARDPFGTPIAFVDDRTLFTGADDA